MSGRRIECFGLYADCAVDLFDNGINMPDGECVRLQSEEMTRAWFFRALGVDVYVSPNWQDEPGLRVQVCSDGRQHRAFTVTTDEIRTAEEYRSALRSGWGRILRAVATALLYREARAPWGAA